MIIRILCSNCITYKANLDAKNGNLDSALVNFNKIIEFTDGYRGNKVFNKLARVSSARINLSNGQVEEALEKKYKVIHPLIQMLIFMS